MLTHLRRDAAGDEEIPVPLLARQGFTQLVEAQPHEGGPHPGVFDVDVHPLYATVRGMVLLPWGMRVLLQERLHARVVEEGFGLPLRPCS